MSQVTIEKIIEHHLVQNQGQKLTPHLITGLIHLISQNARSAGILAATPAADAQPKEAQQ